MSFLDDEPPRFTEGTLRRIARYQRWVLGVVVAQVALWVGYIFLTWARGDNPRAGLGLPVQITFILGIVGGIFTFLLYGTIRGVFGALVMGLGAIPPCFGAFVMLLAYATALATLRTNGVKAGVFGADFDDIENRQLYDDEDAGW